MFDLWLYEKLEVFIRGAHGPDQPGPSLVGALGLLTKVGPV